jgi:hypothetical protein
MGFNSAFKVLNQAAVPSYMLLKNGYFVVAFYSFLLAINFKVQSTVILTSVLLSQTHLVVWSPAMGMRQTNQIKNN